MKKEILTSRPCPNRPHCASIQDIAPPRPHVKPFAVTGCQYDMQSKLKNSHFARMRILVALAGDHWLVRQ